MREINLLILFIPIYFFVSLIRSEKLKYKALLLMSYLYFSIVTENQLYTTLLFVSIIALVYSLNLFKKFFLNSFRLSSVIYLTIIVFIVFKYFQIYEYKNENYFIQNKTPLGFTAACIFIISLFKHYRNRSVIGAVNEQLDPLKSIFVALNGMTSLAGPFLQYKDNAELIDDRSFKILVVYYIILLRGLSKLSMSTLLMYLIDFPISVQNTIRFHSIIILIYSSLFLYFSFSGLSDTIKGSMGLFGFKIPDNFKFPFVSESPSEFWQSWHITLGDFFKRNFYNDIQLFLFRNKFFSKVSAFVSTTILFLFIAIWHEISLKIFFWAITNAVAVFFYKKSKFKFANILFTNFFILLINGLFLSKDISNYISIVGNIFSLKKNIDTIDSVFVLMLFMILFFIFKSEKYISDKITLRSISNLDLIKMFSLSVMYLLIVLSVGFSKTTNLYLGY